MNTITETLNHISGNIHASALISRDGVVIASTLPQNLNGYTFETVNTTIQSVGFQLISSLANGALDHVVINAGKHYILMSHASKESVLAVIVQSYDELDKLISNIKIAAEEMVFIA